MPCNPGTHGRFGGGTGGGRGRAQGGEIGIGNDAGGIPITAMYSVQHFQHPSTFSLVGGPTQNVLRMFNPNPEGFEMCRPMPCSVVQCISCNESNAVQANSNVLRCD